MSNTKDNPQKTATLLVELLTEELPPKALKHLGHEFALKTRDGLAVAGLVDPGAVFAMFATPRRLAVQVPGVLDAAPDTRREVQGPSASAPPQAAEGFAKKCGISVEALRKQQTPKGEVYVAQVTTRGQKLADVLAGKIEAALKGLPVPKVMRWGDGDAQFARPVHGLVMLHGARVVPGTVLGQKSGNQTLGHRFLSSGRVTIRSADGYDQTLLKNGKVTADFSVRRSEIINKINYLCGNSRIPVGSDALYDEITALVEAPAVYEGKFAVEFLELPEECLILSMQQHQKYVPLRDKATGKLLPCFLFVSNLDAKPPREIIHGNERVLRARLSDARFFYDQDRRTRLEARVPRLAGVVYHNKLGTQLERVERIRALAALIAGELKADAKSADRAGFLCKADLSTEMVGEFPELQGVMGRYYALHDGEPKEVADAIEQHYRPRFAGDRLPETSLACSVALADKIEAIVGMFGIGSIPTGDRDPFALRRLALGVVRILCERQLKLHPSVILKAGHSAFPQGMLLDSHKHGDVAVPNYVEAEFFIRDRAKGYLRDMGYSTLEVEAVLDLNPMPAEYVGRLEAAQAFVALPESAGLAEADKRIRNILIKSGGASVIQLAEESRLEIEAEKQLLQTTRRLRPQVDELLKVGKFKDALLLTARIHHPVTTFFEKVMVNVDDPNLRTNRFALLHEVVNLTNRVANISKLAA